jgi:porin
MAYKNNLYALALLAISPLSMAQDWNGTVLGLSLFWAICSAFVNP